MSLTPLDISLGITGWYDGYSYDSTNNVWRNKSSASNLYVLEAGAGGLEGTGPVNTDGSANASSWNSPNYPPIEAFNGTISSNSDGWLTAIGSGGVGGALPFPHWLSFEFPSEKYITKYKIWARNHNDYILAPQAWTLRGATSSSAYNSGTYTVIDTRSNQTNWVQTTGGTSDITNDIKRNEYYVANPGYYKYYVLHITANNNSNNSYVSIGELAYYSEAIHITGTLTPSVNHFNSQLVSYRNNKKYMQKMFKYVAGSITSRITFPIGFLADTSYTLFHVARRDPNGTDLNGRIFDGGIAGYILEAGAGGRNGDGTTGQGVATCKGGFEEHGYYWWGAGPTYVFNNTLIDVSDGEHSNNMFTGGNINNNKIFHIMFEFPTSITITKYKIWGRNELNGTQQPKSWELRGSASSSAYNNGTYDVLDTRNNVPNFGPSNSNSITFDNNRGEYNVPLANQGSYTTYILDITQSHNSNYCFIGEIAYYSANNSNWYSGFNDACSGVTAHDLSYVNTTDRKYGNNWVVSVDRPNYYRSIGYSDFSSGYYDITSGSRTDNASPSSVPQLTINNGSTTDPMTIYNPISNLISTGGIKRSYIYNNEIYITHTFLSDGSFTVIGDPITADVLVVGAGGKGGSGGGGGTYNGVQIGDGQGRSNGGGGGAGQLYYNTHTLSGDIYNIIVGEQTGNNDAENSKIISPIYTSLIIDASGGGKGGQYPNNTDSDNGQPGGSGGGCCGHTASGGTADARSSVNGPYYGNNGGSCSQAHTQFYTYGAGGGGADASGNDGTTKAIYEANTNINFCDGGDGKLITIRYGPAGSTGHSQTPPVGWDTGDVQYYAGGGGGSAPTGVPGTGGGDGGKGGGGRGDDTDDQWGGTPVAGTANTGGGGGGRRGESGGHGGASGGSGIVVIRYKLSVSDLSDLSSCDWNVAEVFAYNRHLSVSEEDSLADYLKFKYLGTNQVSTGDPHIYQLTHDISAVDASNTQQMIKGLPPDISAQTSLIGWYIPEGYNTATNPGFWKDYSGHDNDLSSCGTPALVNDSTYNWISYIKGSKGSSYSDASGFVFPKNLLPTDGSYTIIHVARRVKDASGNATGRIFDSASNKNFYSGFVGSKSGVALHSVDVSAGAPAPAPAADTFSATGGNDIITYTSGGIDYKVHVFTTSDTLTVLKGSKAIDFLLVGGGGAGGGGGNQGHQAGGGGAGQVVYYSGETISSDVTITIGAGATALNRSNGPQNGSNTTFTYGSTTKTAVGGGGGGGGMCTQHNDGSSAGNQKHGGSGGSGGGTGCTDDINSQTGFHGEKHSTSTSGGAWGNPNTQVNQVGYFGSNGGGPGEANADNVSQNVPYWSSHGGGGAGEKGRTSGIGRGGDGGDGKPYEIRYGPPGSYNHSTTPPSGWDGNGRYYGGGGGGTGHTGSDSIQGTGGLGGGGASRYNSSAAVNHGEDGRGGGGGGDFVNNNNSTGGDGGNGIVIIRYVI